MSEVHDHGETNHDEEEQLAPENLRQIVEAVLISAEAPVTPGRLLALFDGLNGKHLRQAIDALKAQYESSGNAFTITEVAGGFQLATRAEYGPWLRKFHDRNPVRLSQAALETLAIVAFKQPVTRAELDAVRGVNSGGVLNTLMELNLIRLAGRSETVGKPMLFATTKEFLVHFGLKSLADLPKPRELQELLAAGEQQAQAREQAAGEPPPVSMTVDEVLASPSPAAPVAAGEPGAPAPETADETPAVAAEEEAPPRA
ncbi:MAG: SMC-Scp complex subunit ScpB [Candidatus Latescibacteria bacterium]|nr:SMC-Scp complex subunit ScpB [Candidatus Latescibacterota bacterium]